MKALVSLGYRKYVMPFEDAVVLIRALENVESFETAYEPSVGQVLYIDNVKPLDVSMEMITDDQYAVAKMRGKKPTKEK